MLAPFQVGAAVSFYFGLDGGGGAQAREAVLAWEAPGGGYPIHSAPLTARAEISGSFKRLPCVAGGNH